MPKDYLHRTLITPTPQSQPLTPDQVPNNAGGYAWAVDKWTRLDRFLILGSEKGTYYFSEQDITKQNINNLTACVAEDGLRVMHRIVEFRQTNRVPKFDACLFALASVTVLASKEAKSEAWTFLPQVAWTATQLFQFMEYRRFFSGGRGRGFKWGINNWYEKKNLDALALQLIKYRQRNDWTHRDVLRLIKPTPTSPQREAIYGWVVGKGKSTCHDLIAAFEDLQACTDPNQAAFIIANYGLPRECVPTELLNNPIVWEALLENMPMMAMVRNLATMTRVGLLTPFSASTVKVCEWLNNVVAVQKTQNHPYNFLQAGMVYGAGHGVKGHHIWKPVPRITEALLNAFHHAFLNVVPSNKKLMMAVDCSGSMNAPVLGSDFMSCTLAAIAMATVTVNTEPRAMLTAFDTKDYLLNVAPKTTFAEMSELFRKLPSGGTNVSVPIRAALEHHYDVDAFVIYTDNESWAGNIHASTAFDNYRKHVNPNAKIVYIAMAANHATLNRPDDGHGFEVVGFDGAAPQLISDFIRG